MNSSDFPAARRAYSVSSVERVKGTEKREGGESERGFKWTVLEVHPMIA